MGHHIIKLHFAVLLTALIVLGCESQSTKKTEATNPYQHDSTTQSELTPYQIQCGKQIISFEVPENYMDTIDTSPEEGFFTTLFWQDGSVIEIYCGSMYVPSFFKDEVKYKVTFIDSSVWGVSHHGIDLKSQQNWRIDQYFNKRLSIHFFGVNSAQKATYNLILDSVHFSKAL